MSLILFDEHESNMSLDSHAIDQLSTQQQQNQQQNSFASRIDYLEDALAAAGLATSTFPGVLRSVDSSDGSAGLNQSQCTVLLDGMIELWKERCKFQQQATQASENMDRIKSDLVHSTQRVSDLKEEKCEAEKKLWECEMRRRGAEKEAIQKEKVLKAELVTLEKKCTMIQRRDNQYKHELRKVEMNFEKIQEKLHKIILEKTTQSTFGGTPGLGATKASQATAQTTNHNGWEITTIRPASSARAAAGSAANKDLPASSADIELLQGTLNTYSERLGQLVQENAQLKQALKSVEKQVQDVLDEPVGAETDGSDEQQFDENGVPLPSASSNTPAPIVPLSPRTLALLADFTPSQIELPWEMVGESVETVLKAKVQLMRERTREQRLGQQEKLEHAKADQLISHLRNTLQQQQLIIQQQDSLLQQALFAAPELEKELKKEQEDLRRLSMQMEAEEVRKRRANLENSFGATGMASSTATATAGPLSSPTSIKILGGRSGVNLPVFQTPVFSKVQLKVQPLKDEAIKPTNAAPPSKSKWLQGGIFSTPTFTPSKKSQMRPGHTGSIDGGIEDESNLSLILASTEESGSFNDDDDSLEPINLDLELDESQHNGEANSSGIVQ